jgi:two-component system chemotaxis response regulator CheB
VAQELIGKIKVAAYTDFSRAPGLPPLNLQKAEKPRHKKSRAPSRVIALGISTGGPNALQYLLSQLPADFPGAIVVVQHMPEGFTDMFARRLDECCTLEVKEAQSGDVLLAGRVLICPGNRHIRVRHTPLGEVVVLSDEPRVNGHRPSVEVLFRSVAQEFGPAAIAVLMTGMGDDGADAMGAVKAAGGMTIAQSKESCTVFGMPRAAIERGHAIRVVGLDVLANTLQAQCMHDGGTGGRAMSTHAGNKD